MDAEDLKEIDLVFKGESMEQKPASIGGNTTVAVSMATAKAAASSYNMPSINS